MSSSKRKRKNKTLKIVIVAVALLIGILSLSYISQVYNKTVKWDDVIYPGVSVGEIDLTGKNKQEATNILTNKYGNAILKKKITVKVLDKSYDMDYSKLNARYNIEEVVNEAMAYGKEGNMFSKHHLIKNPNKKSVDLKFAYDPKYINEFVSDIAKATNRNPVNASIKAVSEGNFKITEDKIGYKLQNENLEKEITEKINGKLGEDIEINAKVDKLKAKTTSYELKKINTKIASFSTNYSKSSNERAYNVELAAKAINGTVLMPGDVFSYNGVVGERTYDKGYKDAPIIVGNKVESGLGGGICQVSSTLYQAVLRTGLKSVERNNHSLPTSYLPIGLDATVVYGNLDYKFKNTYDFPIYIESITQNRMLYFNLYGSSNAKDRTYEIATEVYETVPPEVKIINDPNLAEGQQVVEKYGSNGYKVKVYRKTYENGKLVNTEFISNDYYRPTEGRIRKGTKKS